MNVRGLMLRQAGTMMALGIGIGVIGPLALTRSLASLLFGVNASDPAVYAGVPLLLAVVRCSRSPYPRRARPALIRSRRSERVRL